MEQGQKFKQIRKQRKYTIQRLAQVSGSVASFQTLKITKHHSQMILFSNF
mgnify:CR=1 FL=1